MVDPGVVTVTRTSRNRIVCVLSAFIAVGVLGGCGGGGSGGQRMAPDDGNPASPPSGDTVADTSPFVPAAPYAGVLRTCAYAGDATQACTLDTLPFLGMELTDPGINDVLERTLVSHRWMGTNLQRALELLPADVLPLFRSITAVVIASDVRPAHYDPDTGAIYLDPDFLWLSVAERDTVSTEPDPRSGFGLDLQFQMPWRYVRDNQRLTVFINQDGSRDLSQIIEIMAYLLYHELAHAVDFMPPDRLATLSGNQRVPEALEQEPPLSTSFQGEQPLHSTLLKQLAAVSFRGVSSTAEQRSLQPEDLVSPFVDDGAVQYYAYTSQFEDFAVLFESAMMKWHFGYDKDTAITNRPASGGSDAAVVAWGTRGRLGEQPVYYRALGVGQRIYPGDLAAFEAFLLAEPDPPPRMQTGQTWGQNLTLAPPGSATVTVSPTGTDKSGRTPDYFLERVLIH